MNKQELIKSTFRKLIETNSFDDLTVQKLCKESKINRQTFYYHYSDIIDVVKDYFLNEKIDNLDATTTWPNLVHAILSYANKNRQLILKTLKSKASKAVEEFFFNNLYKKGRFFIEVQYGKTLDKSDINEIAKLVSDSLSREMVRLLSNPMELSISSIEENISGTFDGVLDLICNNRKRKK